MTVIDPRSPWWPLAVSEVLASGRAKGSYPPRLEHWMTWHFHFRLRGEGFVACPAQPTDKLLEAA